MSTLSKIASLLFPDNSTQYIGCPYVQYGTTGTLFTSLPTSISNSTFTFPKPFTGTPFVMISLISSIAFTSGSKAAFICWITSITNTQMQISITNGYSQDINNPFTTNISFSWLAFENPTTSIPKSIGYTFPGTVQQINKQYTAAPTIQTGYTGALTASGTLQSITVIFTPKSFNTIPNVLINIVTTVSTGANTTALVAYVYGISKTQFTIYYINCWPNSISINSIGWIAFGNPN